MGHRFPSDSGPALRGSHPQAFCAWLSLSLREQAAAVQKYLADDPEGLHAASLAAVVAEGENAGLFPSGVLDAERQLFLSDLTVVLRLLGGVGHTLPVRTATPGVASFWNYWKALAYPV